MLSAISSCIDDQGVNISQVISNVGSHGHPPKAIRYIGRGRGRRIGIGRGRGRGEKDRDREREREGGEGEGEGEGGGKGEGGRDDSGYVK